MSVRLNCVKILSKILEEKCFFAALKNQVEEKNAPFVNMLVLTALRRKTAIEALLKQFILKKIPHKNAVLNYVLLCGATELLYTHTPDWAVINEYVEISKQLTDRFSGGLINAVLRKVAVQKENMQEKACFPVNYLNILEQDYAPTDIALMEKLLTHDAPLDISVKENPEKWAEILGGTLFENGTIRLYDLKAKIPALKGYQEGAWWVQDLSASLPVILAGSVKGKKVLDLCAAPGGKTAQLLARGAEVTALDIDPVRLETLKENIKRLQLTDNLQTFASSGQDFLHRTDECFDLILLDAPCSATGTFRKHPEVIHIKSAKDISEACPVQEELLNSACEHLTPSGRIIYCTCSVAKKEGEAQIEKFLHAHPDFALQPFDAENFCLHHGEKLEKNIIDKGVLRTMPYHMFKQGGMDGFFAACLIKNGRK